MRRGVSGYGIPLRAIGLVIALLLLAAACAPPGTPAAGPTPTPKPMPTEPGGWIAFASERDGNFEIYKMRADGSEATRLTENEAFDIVCSWGP